MPRKPPHPPRPPHLDDEDDFYDVPPPPPPPHHRHRHWGLPIPDDFDEAVLRELFGSPEQARAARRIFEGSPPEIAVLAYLVVCSYGKLKDEITGLHERLDRLEDVTGENEFKK
jgi:hypothetical protein